MRKRANVICLLGFWLLGHPLQAEEPDRGTPWQIHIIDDSSRGADGVKLYDIDGDGLLDLTTGWEEGGITRIYRNPGPDKVKATWPALTVGKTHQVEDAAWIDLEHKGTSRAVVSCSEGKTRSVFVHWTPEAKPFENTWEQAVIPASKDRMMWMFAIPAKLSQDASGGEVLVAAGKGPGAEIGWFECTGEPRDLSSYQWHPLSPAGWIMSLYAVDMDGDGDQDLLTTDRKGKHRGCRWLENPGSVSSKGKPWQNHWVGGQDREVMFAHLADLDQDGLQDILVVSRAPDEVHWYRRLDQSGLKWDHRVIPYPQNTGGGKGVAVGDLDRDGQLDLVLSCEHAEPPRSGM
ncbi:MAG: VCBS repeat-containing protein, partial [Gimesia chilikensis]